MRENPWTGHIAFLIGIPADYRPSIYFLGASFLKTRTGSIRGLGRAMPKTKHGPIFSSRANAPIGQSAATG
jgi:hypothetical protein